LRHWAEAARVISRYMLNRAVNSAVRIVFFHLESNSYRLSQKVTSSKYLLNNSTVFMAPHFCGFWCRSFSTW